MSLSSNQIAVLRNHFEAGDRIAYYLVLESFGVQYGGLALDVVLNRGASGSSANTFFLSSAKGEGKTISDNALASISLQLMQRDFDLRKIGADVNVDDIQTYHRDVFQTANVSANAWTPNIYLETFNTTAES